MIDQSGKRILVVEDEIMVAMHLEDLLIAMGHSVVGPVTRLAEALTLASEEDIQFAIIDMNLAGTQTFPVADILRARSIPFIFVTGYGQSGIAATHGPEAILRKPYSAGDLKVAVINGLLSRKF